MLGIYNEHILNNIIKGGKYIIDNFANQEKFHKEIESIFYKLISDNKNYTSPLMEIDIARNNNSYKCNPIDISIDLTKKILQNYNIIRVSSEYTTKDTKLKKIKAMNDNEISKIKEQHNEYCKKLESKITDLENEVKNGQQCIQQCEKTLNDINETLYNLSKNIENSNNETNKTCKGKECHNSNDTQKKATTQARKVILPR